MRRRTPTLLAIPVLVVAALAASGSAFAVGPALVALRGAVLTAPGGTLGYVAKPAGASTRIQARADGEVVRALTILGRWGVQLATLDGGLSGLSANGHVLVLSDNVSPTGSLRTRSRLAVVDARTLTLSRTITLRGEYSVDTLSPDGRFLYLIHHVSQNNATKYQVQAYDLRAGGLLPGVIADKRQAGWLMSGLPVTRTESAGGSWVYTLYQPGNNYPFIHALDTVHRTAICIGIPANWTESWIGSARLALVDGKLEVRTKTGETRYVLDTTTFQVTTP